MPDLFTYIVEENKLNPFYRTISTNPVSEPARIMMNLVFKDFIDKDQNFIEQFQTTGFDARTFELYLYAYFTSDNFKVHRDHDRPDFIIEKDKIRFAVEATTSNSNFVKELNAIDQFLKLTREEIDQRSNDEIPIRLGSPLFSKLQKKYWELEHCKDIPLVIAIEAFHNETALLFSDMSLAQYLFGLRQYPKWSEQGEVDFEVEEVAIHQLGTKVIPSNFFNQPDSEHVSAILFSNSGTYSKFNRMGYQAGFHKGNVELTRTGGYYVPDRGSTKVMPFMYNLGDLDAPTERWSQGVTYIHNPNALYPLPKELLPNTSHIYQVDGKLFSDYPEFHPQASLTNTVHLEGVPLEFPEIHIVSIYKYKFDSFEKGKKPEADLLFKEKQWFADIHENIIGTVLFDRYDKDWAYVIYGKLAKGTFGVLEVKHSIDTRESATSQILGCMEKLYLSGQTTFD